MTRKLIFIAPLAILAMVLFAVVSGEIVLYLWNWLLPPLFSWRQISFWQALGLLTLCRFLFGGVWMARFRSLQFPPSHGRVLRAHDAGGAGAIPPTHARTLRLRPIHLRDQRAMRLSRRALFPILVFNGRTQ